MSREYKPFTETWNELVITPLSRIDDVTFLPGWLEHYATDLNKGLSGRSFPAVAAHSDLEMINSQYSKFDGPATSGNDRSFSIDCAVGIDKSPETVLERLEELYLKVKIAVGNTDKLTLQSAKFMLPENSSPYAFVQIEGVIKYYENWS